MIDNHCSLHLYPFHFTVKDLSSGRMRFKGPDQEGFNPFHFHLSTNGHHKALTLKNFHGGSIPSDLPLPLLMGCWFMSFSVLIILIISVEE